MIQVEARQYQQGGKTSRIISQRGKEMVRKEKEKRIMARIRRRRSLQKEVN